MLPRIANEQYNGTEKVDRTKLLPGDLVFFGPPGSWINIGHVGIYLGGGRMVQAPTTGDVVKVSSVWWSRFYGATRPLPAHKATPPPPPPPPPANPPPAQTPSSRPPSSPPPSSRPPSPPPSSSKPPSSPSPSTPGGTQGSSTSSNPASAPASSSSPPG
jgi:hypothetical protein